MWPELREEVELELAMMREHLEAEMDAFLKATEGKP